MWGSKEEEEEGYNSDRGYNLLIRRGQGRKGRSRIETKAERWKELMRH